MLQVKNGDLDKLGLLFERYKSKLFRYFYRLTHRRDISEDLVQGVFERILRYRHTYENGHAFSTWLYSIAGNVHADYYRENNRNGTLDDMAQTEYLKDRKRDPHELLEEQGNRDLKLLSRAMNKLEPLKKETLVLSRYQGFRYKEIASIMNCSESAVKVRIYRAINELRDLINEMKTTEP